jgi:hypothetical protein
MQHVREGEDAQSHPIYRKLALVVHAGLLQ